MNTTQQLTNLRKNAIKGLLYMDFQRHREGFLIGLPAVVIMSLLVGRSENTGGPMFFWMCLALAIGCGMGFGRSEWFLGLEEHSLALPPTRRDRFFVRYGLGLGFLVTVQLIGLAAGPLRLVRGMWELTGGQLEPYKENAEIWSEFDGPGFYVLCIGLTYAVFTELYSAAINAESGNNAKWSLSLAPFVIVAALVLAVDRHFFVGNVGYLTGIVGALFAFPRAMAGAKKFDRKDIVMDVDAPADGCRTAGRPLLLLVIGLGLLLAVGTVFYMANR